MKLNLIKNIFLKTLIMLKTLTIVGLFLSIKYFLIGNFGLEFVSVEPLFTSFIAGIVFIYGFMLYGTIKEYRDSMEIPYQIRMYLDSILRDGILLKKMHDNFDYEELKKIILNFVVVYNQEFLSKKASMECLNHLYELDKVFIAINALGLPQNFISTIKNKKFEIKKLVIKGYEIKKQEYMPLLSQLQYILTTILVFLMLFLKTQNITQDYIIVGGFMFIFVFLILTLEIMDNPFSKQNYDIYENMENLKTFENLLKTNQL